MTCEIESAPLEEPYWEGKILYTCPSCVSSLTGNSVESVVNEEAALIAACEEYGNDE